MAKVKTVVGASLEYCLTAEDARRLNEGRGPNQQPCEAGQRAALIASEDHGGDCVSGAVKYEGGKIDVQRRNRGYGMGQWDWRS